jgi:hypothetical protein
LRTKISVRSFFFLYAPGSFVVARLPAFDPNSWIGAPFVVVEHCCFRTTAVAMDSDVDSVFDDFGQDESDAYSPEVVRMLRVALYPALIPTSAPLRCQCTQNSFLALFL